MTVSIPDTPSFKTSLEVQSPQEFDALQQASFYYRMRRFLRSTAWVNLFWGGLTLWVGLVSPRPTFLSTVQAILGALIIIQSFLAIVRPRVSGLLVLTILLLLVGFWNIVINIVFNFVSVYLWINILWLIIGIVQVRWAYRTYSLYRVFSAQPTLKPTAELAKKYDHIWESLAHPSPTLSPELIMMQLVGNRYWWNGLLLTDRAILAHKRQHVLMVVAKPDLIVIPDNPKAVQRDQLSMFAQIGAESWMGKIYPASFQQYLQWKGITDSHAELNESINRKRLGRKVSRWFGTLLAIIFWIALVMGMASLPRFR